MSGGEQTQPEYDESKDTPPPAEPTPTPTPDTNYSPETTIPASPSEFVDTSGLEDTRHYPNEELPDTYWQEAMIRADVDNALGVMDDNYQMPRDSFTPITMGFEEDPSFLAAYYGRYFPQEFRNRIVFNRDTAASPYLIQNARENPFSRFMELSSPETALHELGHWMDDNIAQSDKLGETIANTPLEQQLSATVNNASGHHREEAHPFYEWAVRPEERFARVFAQHSMANNEGDSHLGAPPFLNASGAYYGQEDMNMINPVLNNELSPFTRFSPNFEPHMPGRDTNPYSYYQHLSPHIKKPPMTATEYFSLKDPTEVYRPK